MDPQQKKEFIEAINTYYKLKSKYENDFSKMKKKIIDTPGLSWGEKRRTFAKLNPNCINCKRPVKTKFGIVEENGDRQLTAKCGDVKEPCPLNIVINLGNITDLKENVISHKHDINNMKKNIILEKNDLIFNYIKLHNAVQNFDKLKDSIEGTIKMYEYLMELYSNIAHNPEEEAELRILNNGVNEDIYTMKEMIKNFNTSQNIQLIKDMVEIYVNNLIPKIDEMNEKIYAYREVEYNEDNDTYELVQKTYEYSIEKMELDISEKLPQGVISFQTGMEQGSLKKKNKKEKKNKIKNVIIEEEEIEENPDQYQDSELEEKEAREENDLNEQKNPLVQIQNYLKIQKGVNAEADTLSPESDITESEEPEGTTIDAEDANRLKYPITMENGNLVAINPETGRKYNVLISKTEYPKNTPTYESANIIEAEELTESDL